MMNWKEFEIECLDFLKKKYGTSFDLKGESDSTVSDILFDNGCRSFYIEAKMPLAQCGQFVLLPDFNKKIFVYSQKNKTSENEYTTKISHFMNENFDYFHNAGTAGIKIDLDKDIFYGWIINYYRQKGVRFFITRGEYGFILFPIENLSSYFDVSAIYRKKKSGSSRLSKKYKDDFENALIRSHINYSFDGINLISAENLDGRKVYGDNFAYLLREQGGSYRVNRLSNTVNANVIFSIKLIDYDIHQQKLDKLLFDMEVYNQ